MTAGLFSPIGSSQSPKGHPKLLTPIIRQGCLFYTNKAFRTSYRDRASYRHLSLDVCEGPAVKVVYITQIKDSECHG